MSFLKNVIYFKLQCKNVNKFFNLMIGIVCDLLNSDNYESKNNDDVEFLWLSVWMPFDQTCVNTKHSSRQRSTSPERNIHRKHVFARRSKRLAWDSTQSQFIITSLHTVIILTRHNFTQENDNNFSEQNGGFDKSERTLKC